MEHIRTRNDLINWLENNAPSKAIRRALQEGRVENLGAFKNAAFGSKSGWILEVISKHKTTWLVTIYAWHTVFKNFIRDINVVPWEYWVGDKSENKLYQGDHPDIYKLLRDKELQKEV